MYLDYFQLERHPFRITPDTSLFYSGGNRGRGVVLDAMLYAIATGEGILKVVGEVGSGKTMLCRMLEERLPDTTEVVYLANPNLSADEILYAIAFELKLPIRPDTSKLLVMQHLQNFLLKQHAENRKVLVIVEEAQGMPLETLEEIRLFSNLETHRDKLLQIILFGQPELDKNLSGRDIRQLRERITHSFYLPPLTADETGEYIRFRLGAAGCPSPKLFTQAAERWIARASGGLTRRINILSDKALLAAFADNVLASPENLSADVPPVVTWRHALAAIRDSDYGFFPMKLLAYPMRIMTAVALAALVAAGIVYWPLLEVPADQLVSTPTVEVEPVGAMVAFGNSNGAVPVRKLDVVASADVSQIVTPPESRDSQDPPSKIPVSANKDEVALEEPRIASRLEIAADELAEGVVQISVPDPAESMIDSEPEAALIRETALIQEAAGDAVAELTVATDTVLEPVALSPAQSFTGGEGESPASAESLNLESSSQSDKLPAGAAQHAQSLLAIETEPDSLVETTVETASQSQSGSLTFANSKHIRNRVIASTEWLEAADRKGYTVQFLSGPTSNLEFAESFFARLDQAGLLDESYLCMSINGGESYWTIKHGNFAGLSVGQRFINQLPGDLFDYKPFVQNMGGVECNSNHSLAALILE